MANQVIDKSNLHRNKYCAVCDKPQPISNIDDACEVCGTPEMSNPPPGIKEKIRQGLREGKVIQRPEPSTVVE